MKLGIDVLLHDKNLRKQLLGKRVALLGHPASITSDLQHSLDALIKCSDLQIASAFGPQHGMRGEKQDNMVETEDYLDPLYKIPVFSLYGEVRRPTDKMLDSFDVLLIDLQDVGTRIYTFLTTLLYVLEAAAAKNKSVWVLDRPNPAGRPVEGSLLKNGWVSFVGASHFPMRHGMTLGECALWFQKIHRINVDLKVIALEGYDPVQGPGYGWTANELPWVNPSPNAATLSMARCFPGTVLIEGTHLSEARGTTHPLEMVGASDIEILPLLQEMQKLAPQWLEGFWLRPCYFQPTFHKHSGKICQGFQMHVDHPQYKHELFKPYRVIALWLKAIRNLYPDYQIWRDFHYEYEKDRLAFDLINGGTFLREWVDDRESTARDLDLYCVPDENQWREQRREFLLYPS